MDDLPTPDSAEQQRRERIPSLQGNTPIINPTVEEILARFQASLHRNLTITTTTHEDDGTYSVMFRYLTNEQAARIITLSRRVRPLPQAAKRDLDALDRAPHILKRRKMRTRGRIHGATGTPHDVIRSKVKRAEQLKAAGYSWSVIAARLSEHQTTLHRWVMATRRNPRVYS